MSNILKIKEILAQLAAKLGTVYSKDSLITSIAADGRLIHVVLGLIWTPDNPPEEMPSYWRSEIAETSPGVINAIFETGFKTMNHLLFSTDHNHEAYFIQVGDAFAMLVVTKEKHYIPSSRLVEHDKVVSEVAKDIGYDLTEGATYAMIDRWGWGANTVEIVGTTLPYCKVVLSDPSKTYLPRESVLIPPSDKRLTELDKKLMANGYLAYFGYKGHWEYSSGEDNKERIYVKQFGNIAATIYTTLP